MKNEIIERLAGWRKERGLSIEGQRKGLDKNLKEEIAELEEAIKKSNELEIIDALCDVCVLLINSGFDVSVEERIGLFEKNYKGEDIAKDLATLLECNDYVAIGAYAVTSMSFLGYSVPKCLLETIKEIESRTGSWCEKSKKWLKDTSPEAQAKWYKADYSKCKIHQ